jgi:hypothetical protein
VPLVGWWRQVADGVVFVSLRLLERGAARSAAGPTGRLCRPAAGPSTVWADDTRVSVEDLGAPGDAHRANDQPIPAAHHVHVPVVPIAEGARDVAVPGIGLLGAHPVTLPTFAGPALPAQSAMIHRTHPPRVAGVPLGVVSRRRRLPWVSGSGSGARRWPGARESLDWRPFIGQRFACCGGPSGRVAATALSAECRVGDGRLEELALGPLAGAEEGPNAQPGR